MSPDTEQTCGSRPQASRLTSGREDGEHRRRLRYHPSLARRSQEGGGQGRRVRGRVDVDGHLNGFVKTTA